MGNENGRAQESAVTSGGAAFANRWGPGFVGREREMEELRAALEDALGGQGRLVMLAGEPGIGKTRMAKELAAHAEQLGAHVWWGRC